MLYGFTGGADGGQPYAGLIDYGGFLWGTTYDGGASNDGTVFKINLATGAETTVYTFTGVPDGSHARGQLVYHQGLLFGTTFDGGKYDGGTVFSINPKAGTEAVLYSFSVGADGLSPLAGVVAKAGALYGTSYRGGALQYGVAFKIKSKTGAETVLHDFRGGADGGTPFAGLTFVGTDLFGATTAGGAAGIGTIFKIGLKPHRETVLYSFEGGTDGEDPEASLLAQGGGLYATTYDGGAGGYGTVVQVSASTGDETVLHSFSGVADGANPAGTPVMLGGNLYGVTTSGPGFGVGSYGTVWMLTP